MLRPLIPYQINLSPYIVPGLPRKRTTTTQDIIVEAVCNQYNLIFEAICKRTRKRNIVEARQVIMYLLCHYTTASLKRIGDLFGGYDHTTVIHSRKQITDLLYTDRDLANRMAEIKRKAELVDRIPRKITRLKDDNTNS
jgi:chromosomal replication initiation ATPase DnaA